MSRYEYKLTVPGKRTRYYRTFFGAYDQLVRVLHDAADSAQASPDGPALWYRTAANWTYDQTNTAEAFREVQQVRNYRAGTN